ncbi:MULTISPECIES: hypothetical protein [Brenneria]|nr:MULTISPECIES: hypothetical protein [Brenneria]
MSKKILTKKYKFFVNKFFRVFEKPGKTCEGIHCGGIILNINNP